MKSLEISKYIHCYDQIGSDPNAGGTQKSTASCTAPFTITSCGAEPAFTGTFESLGSYINNKEECVSLSDFAATQAIARCCNLTDYGSSFQLESFASIQSSGVSACPLTTDQLIGCTAEGQGDSSSNIMNGMYAGYSANVGDTTDTFDTGNQCISENGADGIAIYPSLRCYDSTTITDGYQLNCVSVWGQMSNNTPTGTSTVSCPTDKDHYFMTSCTAYSPLSNIESYTVQGDVCTAKHEPDGTYVFANAICCRMTKTVPDIPTVTTTLQPTTPTDVPSNNPSSILTTNPTDIPSTNPSVDPSTNPSTIPTDDPVTNPVTIHPTFSPITTTTRSITAIPIIFTSKPSNTDVFPRISASINRTSQLYRGEAEVLTTQNVNVPIVTASTTLSSFVYADIGNYILWGLIGFTGCVCGVAVCCLYRYFIINKRREQHIHMMEKEPVTNMVNSVSVVQTGHVAPPPPLSYDAMSGKELRSAAEDDESGESNVDDMYVNVVTPQGGVNDVEDNVVPGAVEPQNVNVTPIGWNNDANVPGVPGEVDPNSML